MTIRHSIAILSLLTASFTLTTTAQAKTDLVVVDHTVSPMVASMQAADHLSALRYAVPQWEQARVEAALPLSDFDGYVTAYLFAIFNAEQPVGYVIVSADDRQPGVLEEARSGDNPYVGVPSSDAIYVGPLMYYAKTDQDVFHDLKNQQTLKRTELKSSGPLSRESKDLRLGTGSLTVAPSSPVQTRSTSPATLNTVTTAPILTASKRLPNVGDTQWYLGCSPTAAANVAQYWDLYGYPNLISSPQALNSVVEELAVYMKTDVYGNTTYADLATGLRTFWTAKGYNATVTSHYPATLAQFQSEIDAGRPLLLNVYEDPTYGDHTMTGMGYEVWDNSTTKLIVHDTWDITPTDVVITWDTTDKALYKIIPN